MLADKQTLSQGIYPTLIMVLVCLDRSHVNRVRTYDIGESMKFASTPPSETLPRAHRRETPSHLRLSNIILEHGVFETTSDEATRDSYDPQEKDVGEV